MTDNNELELKHDINDKVSATVNLNEDKQSISANYKISDATILSMTNPNNASQSVYPVSIKME